ncbi:MAG: NDP-sugar synthase [Nitrososphaerota archaeon]|nr:NDP-sugar synthase [Nitrososphaerota archaeon]
MIRARESKPGEHLEMKAVVLAGGEGTRLRPLTLTRPKPMIPLGPEPAIHYVLSQLSREGFREIVMVTGYLRNQIMEYLGDGSNLGLRITYAVEPDEFLCGTAGSLKLIEHLLDETFLVAQADTLSEIPLTEALKLHRRNGAYATIALTRVKNPSVFGVAVIDADSTITEFQEKPPKEQVRSDLASTGFYILEPEALDHIESEKWDFAKDLFPRLLKLDKKLSGFVSEAFWVDIGSLSGYLRGTRWVLGGTNGKAPHNADNAGLRNPVVTDADAHVGRSVLITGPALIEKEVVIEDEAKIGQDCVIKRSARISSGTALDRSVIMERASIGRDCTISGSVIGQAADLQRNVAVEGSIIGPGCVIGEGAHILSGSRIWPNVRIEANARVNGIVAVPLEKAFYFYTGLGQYTGILATSIEEFVQALEKAPMGSIEFHASRRDFEKWVRQVLASDELADGVEAIRRRAVTGEELRRDLVEVTKEWADKVSSR